MTINKYNTSLFSRGLRSRLHLARFHWCHNILQDYKIPHSAVLELGCFDAKTLEYLRIVPEMYDGYDANWDGGLDIGREKWARIIGIKLHESPSIDCFLRNNTRTYELSICMETLEHLPREDVPTYLSKIAEATSGYLLITVPNEVGFVFVAKWLCKKLFIGSARPYSLREFVYQALGRVENVTQKEHKGFSYRRLISEVEKHFHVVRIDGLPWSRLPLCFSFTVGIVCARKG